MVADEFARLTLKPFRSRQIHRFFATPFFILLGVLFTTLSILPEKTFAQSAPSREYQIKAAFLFNFAQFVEWPSNTFTNTDAPFTIGILGDDPFGGALDETVHGETIQSHKLIIQRSQHWEDLQNCQLLFVSKSEKGKTADILAKLNAKTILTVSELPNFTRNGGIISFYPEGSKVRFEINLAVAERQGLKISSQLLSLGRIVTAAPGKENK